jgi:uncharacterized protein
LAACLEARGDAMAAYCFGSQARAGIPSPRDADIAILAERALSLDETLALRRDLSLLLKTDRLDMVDLRRAGPALKRNVIAGGTRFYCRDEHAANEFELQALHEYQDSAERRRVQMRVLRQELAIP